MSFVSSFLSLFSLSVLDTRLNPPDDEKKRQSVILSAGKSRWNTKEYYIYGLVFLVTVPTMFMTVIDASSTANINYSKYEHKLSDGWLFGRKVDNSDAQYSTIRGNLPILFAVNILHFIIGRGLQRFGLISWKNFNLIFSIVFLLVIHGINVFKILTILLINYYISLHTQGRTNRILTWVFGVGILFSNELLEGYPFRRFCPPLAFLDAYGGILPRWDVNFNFSMLRMVSFSMDRLLASEFWESKGSSDKDKPSESTQSERERIDTPLPLEQYSISNYLSYALYSPLYMAGPIITFNDFQRQAKVTLPSITPHRIYQYALRLVFCLLCMEFILHFMYVVAICDTRAWEGDTPFQISMIAFFNLNVIWLKLLIPWRVFRLWAMTDGIDPPENMIRCMNNNYSALSFWRAWHRSFNKWITRYIYIPMGGSRTSPVLNALVVFSFVAIWHDIQLRLLIWGWLVVLFILPEILATLVFPQKKWGSNPLYRHICGVGAVLNIWMMMIANLVGFAVGTDGIADMLGQMFKTTSGLLFVIVSSVCLFVGSQVMFEFRETEKRRGVYLRC